MSVNRAILVGHVGRDPEIRTAQSGDHVATFSLATTESWKDKATGERRDETQWHQIVIFNQNIVAIARDHVKKGGRVAIEGAIKTREYTDRDGVKRRTTEIVIGRFDGRLSLEGQPTGAPRDEHGYGAQKSRPPAATSDDPRSQQAPPPTSRMIDDDIPF